MTTIDDIRAVERLMQTLDENPRLLEAVRSRVLTREVRELPQIVTNLALRVDRLAEQPQQVVEQPRAFNKSVQEAIARDGPV